MTLKYKNIILDKDKIILKYKGKEYELKVVSKSCFLEGSKEVYRIVYSNNKFEIIRDIIFENKIDGVSTTGRIIFVNKEKEEYLIFSEIYFLDEYLSKMEGGDER